MYLVLAGYSVIDVLVNLTKCGIILNEVLFKENVKTNLFVAQTFLRLSNLFHGDVSVLK